MLRNAGIRIIVKSDKRSSRGRLGVSIRLFESAGGSMQLLKQLRERSVAEQHEDDKTQCERHAIKNSLETRETSRVCLPKQCQGPSEVDDKSCVDGKENRLTIE
jgi:hypothetical protein